MNAVTKRPSGSVTASWSLTCLNAVSRLATEAERDAQHRVHLRDRQRRRDAMPSGVAQNDQQTLVDRCEVEGIAPRLRGRQERAVDVVADT